MHRNNLFKPNTLVLANVSTRNHPKPTCLNTHFPHFTAGRLAPRLAQYQTASRREVFLVVSLQAIFTSQWQRRRRKAMKFAPARTPGRFQARLPSGFAMCKQIPGEHPKLQQPILRSTDVPQTSPPQSRVAHASK